MANYRWSICEPQIPHIIEKGSIAKNKVMETFEHFPWSSYLQQMAGMKQDDIHYSPSLEFENLETKQGVTFSIIGDVTYHEFYIFYKRPKAVSYLFGLVKQDAEEYLSDITGQTKEDAKDFLTAFLNNDSVFLEGKMK